MYRGDLGKVDINGIPVMSFSELNSIMNNQYPGYRNKASYFSSARLSVGGSMSLSTFGRSMSNNLSDSINGKMDSEMISSPPLFSSLINLPAKQV